MDERKSKVVAGILAICFGTLGIHNFYLGYTAKGIIQLSATIVSCILGTLLSVILIGLVFFLVPTAIWIWAVIEAIFIFTGKIDCDAKGIPLKD